MKKKTKTMKQLPDTDDPLERIRQELLERQKAAGYTFTTAKLDPESEELIARMVREIAGL